MSTMSELAITMYQALDYAEKGWHVLPVKPNGKDPYFDLAPRAYLSATNDAATIENWFDRRPDINIGIAAIQSGLIIVDVDHRTLGKPGEALLPDLPESYTVRTGDGFHVYYLDPGNLRVPGKIVEGIELKHKGYVVAAPSTHPNGSTYTITNDRDPIPFPVELLSARFGR